MAGPAKKIRRDIKRERRARISRVNTAQALYERGVGDTNYLAAEVGDYLGSMGNKIKQGYTDTGSSLSAANAALQAQLQATTQQNASVAQSEQGRLGLGGAGVGSMRDDSNFSQLIAQQQGQNSVDNNNMMSNNADAIGQLLMGMNQGQRQSNLGQLQNQRNDTVTQARNDFQEYRIKARQLINDIRSRQASSRRSSRSYGGGYSSGGYSSSGGGSNKYENNVAGSKAILKWLQNNPPKQEQPSADSQPWNIFGS